MNIDKILRACDHTLLKQDATEKEVFKLCDDAIEYKTASVCIPPSFVRSASEYVEGKVKICTVIGFPNGYNTLESKSFETFDAIQNGADEIDMVINIGHLKDKKYDLVSKEIDVIKSICDDIVFKVIIETCLLSDEEKITMCNIVDESEADYIKTSTGFSSGGATFDDIKLIRQNIKRAKIKAAGGISSLEDAQTFLDLGASRLGTSRIVKLVKEYKE